MPFVQGHLRHQPIGVTIRSECGHCARPMRLEIGPDLDCRVLEGEAPLVYVPLVDFRKLKAPSIIDDF